MDLKDKVIVVTGAAQGLGRQFAVDVAAQGGKLALADRNPEQLEKTRQELASTGADVRSYELDVSKEAEVEGFYAQVVSDFGTLDGSINNAGVLRDSLLVKVKDGQLQKFPLDKWQAVQTSLPCPRPHPPRSQNA